jgi:hypothetical protein
LRLLGEFEARDQTDQLVPILAKKNRALLAALALAPSPVAPITVLIFA